MLGSRSFALWNSISTQCTRSPLEPPLDGIREAVQALLKVEGEVLNAFKAGRPDIAERGLSSAARMENRAYHFMSHNMLNQILERVKRLESQRP